MQLYEGLKFKRKGNPNVYTVVEIKDNKLMLQVTNTVSGFGQYSTMSEEYFYACDKIGCWEELS